MIIETGNVYTESEKQITLKVTASVAELQYCKITPLVQQAPLSQEIIEMHYKSVIAMLESELRSAVSIICSGSDLI